MSLGPIFAGEGWGEGSGQERREPDSFGLRRPSCAGAVPAAAPPPPPGAQPWVALPVGHQHTGDPRHQHQVNNQSDGGQPLTRQPVTFRWYCLCLWKKWALSEAFLSMTGDYFMQKLEAEGLDPYPWLQLITSTSLLQSVREKGLDSMTSHREVPSKRGASTARAWKCLSASELEQESGLPQRAGRSFLYTTCSFKTRPRIICMESWSGWKWGWGSFHRSLPLYRFPGETKWAQTFWTWKWR